jgi:hypothetical protein
VIFQSIKFSSNFSLIFLAITGVLSLAGVVCYLHLEPTNGSLRESLINDSKLISAAPFIRKDLDDLVGLKSFKEARERLAIVDPILNANGYITKNFSGHAGLGNGKPMITQQTYDLLIQSPDWLVAPMIGFILDTPFLQLQNLDLFGYWSPPSIHSDYKSSEQESLQPNLRAMDTWVKIRLRSTDYFPYLDLQNTQDIYQFAILAIGSEQLPLVLSGLKWLELLHQYQAERNNLPLIPLLPASAPKENFTKFTKTLWATVGYIDWAVQKDIFSIIFPSFATSSADSIVLCTALTERLPGLAFEHQFLQAAYPDAFATFKERIQATISQCRPSPSIQKWLQIVNQPHGTERTLLTGLSSLALLGRGRPNYLGPYQ